MRVLMLSWEYPPHNVGGLGKHVTELVPALLDLGIEVHLLTPRWLGGPEEEAIEDLFTVHRIDPPDVAMTDFFTAAQRTNLHLASKGRELIRERGPFDLIHAHDWLVAFAGIELKHEFKLPLLATIHATEYGRNHGSIGTEIQRAIHNVEWWLTFEAWRVIACTRFMRDEIAVALRTPIDKIDVIPNGVDTSRFDALAGQDLAAFRSRWSPAGDALVFNVGRVVYEKGVQTIVEAAPRVLARRPNTQFVIAGTGGYLDSLRARTAELGLLHRITFAGFISDDDRDRLFKVADVAVFPSLYEPFGIVALEAMAAGTPVVVADVGGFREVVDLHETGLTVYPDSPESLAWGILHTLDHPDWTRARVENATRVVRSHYTWQTIAEQTRRVYDRIAAERRSTNW